MSFKRIDGGLRQVSAGADGTIVGTNDADDIYFRDNYSVPWRQIPGKLTMVKCASIGQICGVNSAGDCYVWRATEWQQIPGILATCIDIGVDGTVVANTAAGDIYMLNRVSNEWSKLTGNLSFVTVGDINRIYGTNQAQDIWRWDVAAHTWKQLPGKAQTVAASYDGVLYAENAGNVYSWDQRSDNWVPATEVGMKVRSFSVGSMTKGVVVAHGTADIYVRH